MDEAWEGVWSSRIERVGFQVFGREEFVSYERKREPSAPRAFL